MELVCAAGGNATGAATVENSMEVPQNFRHRTTTWSRNSTSGSLSEENENTNSKRYMHLYAHWTIICNSQDTEAI